MVQRVVDTDHGEARDRVLDKYDDQINMIKAEQNIHISRVSSADSFLGTPSRSVNDTWQIIHSPTAYSLLHQSPLTSLSTL